MAGVASTDFDFEAIEAQLIATRNTPTLYQNIVNAPFDFPAATASIFLGIIVLLLVDEQQQTIDRIALSDTAQADATKQVSAKPFNDIRIPLNSEDNLIAKVIRSGEAKGTADWEQLFVPELTGEQARINQANAGIGYSAVYPVLSKGKTQGALIYSYFQYPEDIADHHTEFMDRYTDLVAKRLG